MAAEKEEKDSPHPDLGKNRESDCGGGSSSSSNSSPEENNRSKLPSSGEAALAVESKGETAEGSGSSVKPQTDARILSEWAEAADEGNVSREISVSSFEAEESILFESAGTAAANGKDSSEVSPHRDDEIVSVCR